MKILILNGPNLNLLGLREPEIYGKEDYAALCRRVEAACEGIDFEIYQSNHEGDLVDKIQAAYGDAEGIVLNAGAYTHTSVAILDALRAVKIPTVEVHLTDISKREEFRHISYVSLAAEKVIKGHGIAGYEEAIAYLREKYGRV